MKNRNFLLFLLASACIGISQSIDNAVFNNFLNDTFHLTVSQRTILEIPREFPGMMVVFVSGLLLFLGDVRIASIANVLAALGMFSVGFLSSSFGTMVAWLTVYSMGTHLFMPVSNSIGMNLANSGNMGRKLGQINAANTAAFLGTSLLTAFVFKQIRADYGSAFMIGAMAYLVSAVLIFFMTPNKLRQKPRKLILKKEYKLFYFLSIVYGARKQIFITFGPWVLIKIFNQGVSTFAILGFAIAGLGIFVKPLVGHLVDKMGERFVLAADAFVLIAVCSGYAFSESITTAFGKGEWALYMVCSCYVIDQVLTATGIARATYLKKIAVCPEDVSPTLSMGISMDHIVSMILPWMGAAIWNNFGYQFVFLAGAGFALINLFLAAKIHVNSYKEEAEIDLN